MSTDVLKISKEWYDDLTALNGTKIIDPIGWDQSNFTRSFYEELISEEEFKARLALSKIEIPKKEKTRS